MRRAHHPTTGEWISVENYHQEFGHEAIQRSDFRPKVVCPYCGERLHARAGRTVGTEGHFAHSPNSGPCPSKAVAGFPYLSLTPTHPDAAHGASLRKAFFDEWQLYFHQIRTLVPALSYDEFVTLVAEGTKLRIWEYRHMQAWEIPYVFVLLKDFPIGSGVKNRRGNLERKYWYRFWYDASIRSLDDLWIDRADLPILHRASLRDPMVLGAIPDLSAMAGGVKTFVASADFLEKTKPSFPQTVSDQIAAELRRILGL